MALDNARRWQVVYDELRSLMEQGRLGPGDQVPAEETLAERHGVSRQTVRAALQRLQQDGRITEGRGRLGRQVRQYAPLYWNLTDFERGPSRDDPSAGIDEWKADMTTQGVSPRQEISVRIMPAPGWVAGYLRTNPGVMVLRRRRLRIADDIPVAIADTWVPETVGRLEVEGKAPLLDPADVVLPGGIFRSLGFNQVELEDEISVRMPTPDEADLLGLSVGSPVGQVDRLGLSPEGEPIRLLSTVFAGHRLKLRYRLTV